MPTGALDQDVSLSPARFQMEQLRLATLQANRLADIEAALSEQAEDVARIRRVADLWQTLAVLGLILGALGVLGYIFVSCAA